MSVPPGRSRLPEIALMHSSSQKQGGAATSLIDAGRHVERGAAGGRVARGPDRGASSAEMPVTSCLTVGVHASIVRSRRVEAGHEPIDARAVDRSDLDQLTAEGGEEEEVGVRANEEVLARLRALDPARIHEHDAPAALDDRVEALARARQVIERIARHDRIRAQHHQELRALDVGMREPHRRAVHVLVDTELVHRVAGAGAVHALRAERRESAPRNSGASTFAPPAEPTKWPIACGPRRAISRLITTAISRSACVPRDVGPFAADPLLRAQRCDPGCAASTRSACPSRTHSPGSRRDRGRAGYRRCDCSRLDAKPAGRLADATERVVGLLSLNEGNSPLALLGKAQQGPTPRSSLRFGRPRGGRRVFA